LNCEKGGHELSPKPGYWRFNDNSSHFIKCSYENACLGGIGADSTELEFYSGKCDLGYEGPLCSLCSNDYGKIDKYRCEQCASTLSFVVAAIKLILGFASSIYSLYLGTEFVRLLLKAYLLLVHSNLLAAQLRIKIQSDCELYNEIANISSLSNYISSF